MPILDAHTHIFPPFVIERRERIAATERAFAMIYGSPGSRMIDAVQLAQYMDGDGPDAVVSVGFPFEDPDLIRRCNDYLLEAADSDKRITTLVSIDRNDEAEALAEVERCLKLGARGVGELAYYDTGFSENERVRLGGLARRLEEGGAVLMLHLNEQVGHQYPGKMRADFASVAGFVADHPSLRIVLAHMGGGICFYEFMPEIKKSFANVYYDLAAAPFLYSDGLYTFAAAYLCEKVLFGSDYPLLPLARYAPRLQGLDEPARTNILYENGRRLFGA